MKTIIKLVVYVFIVGAVVVSGCANVQSNKTDVIIEKDTSSRGRIQNVLVTPTDSTVIVSGTLHNRNFSRAPIPGHLDITFLSPDGEVLHKLKTDYRRNSIKPRDSYFRIEVPMVLPPDSIVRVKYHRGQ